MPRRGLNRATVVETAAVLADTRGVERLTLASVAERLGVSSPSLYNHVSGLDGLRREVALFGLANLSARLARATMGKVRGDAVLALTDAYRSFARERPGLYALIVLRPPEQADDELWRAGQESVALALAALAGFGLSADEAMHATRALRALVHGFVALETSGGFGVPLDLDESFQRMVRTFVGALERHG